MYPTIFPDALTSTYTSLQDLARNGLTPGCRRMAHDGAKTYKLVKNGHSAALVVGYPVVYDQTNDVTLVTVTQPATALLGFAAGVAMGAIPISGYGWVQVDGYNSSVPLDGTTDVAVGDVLIGVNAAFNLAKSVGAGTAALYANHYVAAEAYTTNSVASKKVYVNCNNLA